jgi:hypothetical protein
MADRLGDPDLRVHARLVAFITLWAPDTAEERRDLAATALAVSRETGDEHSQVLAGTLMAIALGELGQPASMWEVFEEARARAERLRYVYALLVLDSMTVPWLAMAGRFEEAEGRLTSMIELATQSSLHQVDDAIQGNFLALALWRDRTAPDGLVETLEQMPFPMTSAIVATLWIFGEEQQALDYLGAHEVDLTPQDWFTMLNWCWTAVAAACSRDAELGAESYRLLAPFAGHGCSAGSGVSNGPVDAYLALAAYATGEREVAARHAEDAVRLAEEWQIPLFTAWLKEQRERLGF